MGYTTTFTVTDAADVAIVANTNAGTITVREDPSVSGWPTAAFLIKKPSSSSSPITAAIGEQYTFSPSNRALPAFQVGETVGYIRLATVASTTFSQDEN